MGYLELVFIRVAIPGDTGKLPLKGLAPQASHEKVVMETKGVWVAKAIYLVFSALTCFPEHLEEKGSRELTRSGGGGGN